MWTQELFGVEKPIIALLHLDPMPGDPGFCGKLETVLAHARADLEALQAGGVDGILFANEFSRPYQAVPDIAMISAMAYIIGNLRSALDRPFGVNVVKNPIATIDLAAATGASFARNSFSGAYAGEYGLFSASSGEAARHRQALGIPGMKLLYKVNPESDAFLAPRDLRVVAKSILYGGFADGLCVSGSAAGSEPDDAGGRAMRVDLRGMFGGQLQVFSPPWPMWQGRWYRVSFRVKGFDHPGTVETLVRQRPYPWRVYATGPRFRPSNEWKKRWLLGGVD